MRILLNTKKIARIIGDLSGHTNDMNKQYFKPVQAVLLVCTVLLLSGCGSLANKNFPTLSGIKKVAQDAMTPEQQKDAIRDLTLEQKSHQDSAIAEIERK
ncbi:MAG: hypothetical protein ACR2OW_10890 [Methyloligellaceae bacterium]